MTDRDAAYEEAKREAWFRHGQKADCANKEIPGPRTAEEMMALPIGGGFSRVTCAVTDEDRLRGFLTMEDGHPFKIDPDAPPQITILVQEPTIAYYTGDGLVFSCVGDGETWKLGRYADGRWFRERAF